MSQTNVFHAQELKKKVTVSVNLHYLLYLPSDYKTSTKRYPVIFFLHGSGEKGNDLSFVHKLPLLKYAESHPDFPFIVIAPQCPEIHRWSEQLVDINALLDDIIKQYRVDESRIYLTGLSMGGEGTWRLAMKYPQRFAAIAPLCGWADLRLAYKVKSLPIWVFHGDKDDTVPFRQSEEIVDYLKKAGADIKFTVIPGASHDIWTQTYGSSTIYDWFLAHQKK